MRFVSFIGSVVVTLFLIAKNKTIAKTTAAPIAQYIARFGLRTSARGVVRVLLAGVVYVVAIRFPFPKGLKLYLLAIQNSCHVLRSVVRLETCNAVILAVEVSKVSTHF